MDQPRLGRLLNALSSLACVGLAPVTLAAIFAAAFAAPALAQLQLMELPKQYLPRKGVGILGGIVRSTAAAAGDVDGNGTVDLVFASWGDPHILLLNSGDGVFRDVSARQLPAPRFVKTYSVALGDVEGDGDLDIVLGTDNRNHLFLNDGAGFFDRVTSMQMPSMSGSTRDIAFSDVDGDGDPDLVVGNVGQDELLLNDGRGFFFDVTATNLPTASSPTDSVAVGDVDGDGDPDIALAGSVASLQLNRLYLNDGRGVFSDVTPTQMPAQPGDTTDLELGDFDADGDLDMVVANATGQSCILRNDGSGTFAIVPGTTLPASPPPARSLRHVSVGDVDGDTDLDLVFSDSTDRDRLFLNDGTGGFVEATEQALPAVRSLSREVMLSDLDRDNDLDVVVCHDEWNRLYLNDGAGIFEDATAPRMPARRLFTTVCAAADVDGDRDLDLFFGAASSLAPFGNDYLLLNCGNGFFRDASASLPLSPQMTYAAAFGDADGDRDLDLVVGTTSETHNTRLYLNDGSGRFADVTAKNMPSDADESSDVTFVDVDGDADMDIVVAKGRNRVPAVNRLFLNDGSGVFADAPPGAFPQLLDVTEALTVGDVDGDGDQDLVFANSVGGATPPLDSLYLNDGAGTFTHRPTLLPPTNEITEAVALGDADGDGDLDLFSVHQVVTTLYENDGFGNFTTTPGRGIAPRVFDLALGDLDEDGDLDVITTGPGYYLNTGQGVYQQVTSSRLSVSPGGYDVVLGDVDNDTDLDVILAVPNWYDALLVNVLRQLDTPQFLRPGRRAVFDVYARYGNAGPGDTALVMISTMPAAIPLPPLGTFGLDPQTLFLLPPVVVSQPAGVGQVAFVMPNVASFAGVPVYAQAALQYESTGTILTNVTYDVIMP